MFGQQIIARSIGLARIPDRYDNLWQYNPQSDKHSKIACWALLFDLLRTCPLLREHVETGKVGFGINHQMSDFQQDKKKDLDLVLCAKGNNVGPALNFMEYGDRCGVHLLPPERTELSLLPVLHSAAVSNVYLALEAKACMTEHIKALPRLHDELNSSHQTIHGDTGSAIAAGFVTINSATSFISPNRNRHHLTEENTKITSHKQPHAINRTVGAVMKIRRRTQDQESGFDAVGVTMIQCANDMSQVTLDSAANAGLPEIVRYASFVHRIAHLYSTKFNGL